MVGHIGDESPQVVRNRTNQVCGWLLWALLAGVWCLNDPMGLVYPEPGWATRPEGLLATAGFAVGSVVGVVIFAVPYVRLDAQVLVVQNCLSRWCIPSQLITAVLQSGSWPVLVLADGRRVRLVAAERSAWMRMRGLSVVDGGRLESSSLVAGVEPVQVQRVWRVPIQALVVVAVWCLLAAAGLAFGRFV